MTRPIEAERNGALLDWYTRHGRSLPWRSRSDAYATLVSELMLHQTQASRVVPYFERFMETFPTMDDLAAAPFTAVAAVWSGLGYNKRAKRLHEAAQVVSEHGWPDTVAGLERLPGVGPYTARAIAAFAFGAQVAAVDTNVRRVLSRWHGEALAGDQLQAVADADLDDEDAAAWNQAVMDLGASVCRPRNPACLACPVADWCVGPDVYVPPRPQSRFEGSLRQVRGAVVRHLVTTPATFRELVSATGFDPAAIVEALSHLQDDDLVAQTNDFYHLTD